MTKPELYKGDIRQKIFAFFTQYTIYQRFFLNFRVLLATLNFL